MYFRRNEKQNSRRGGVQWVEGGKDGWVGQKRDSPTLPGLPEVWRRVVYGGGWGVGGGRGGIDLIGSPFIWD